MEKSLTNCIKLRFRNIFIEVYLVYNIVLVSGVQQNESDIYMYIYIYAYIYAHIYATFQIIFHYMLLQDFEYCFLCYAVDSSCLSISYIAVCIC